MALSKHALTPCRPQPRTRRTKRLHRSTTWAPTRSPACSSPSSSPPRRASSTSRPSRTASRASRMCTRCSRTGRAASTSTTSWRMCTLRLSCSGGAWGAGAGRVRLMGCNLLAHSAMRPIRLRTLLNPNPNLHPNPAQTYRHHPNQTGCQGAAGVRGRPRGGAHQHLQQQPEAFKGPDQRYDQQVLRAPAGGLVGRRR